MALEGDQHAPGANTLRAEVLIQISWLQLCLVDQAQAVEAFMALNCPSLLWENEFSTSFNQGKPA